MKRIYICEDCGEFIPKDQIVKDGAGSFHAGCSTGSVISLDIEDFLATAIEIGQLVEKKNAAYGSSFERCGDFLRLLYPEGMKPEQYKDALLLVRIFDKQMRIATAKDALGENPYQDIAGYGILGAALESK